MNFLGSNFTSQQIHSQQLQQAGLMVQWLISELST